MAEMQSTCLQTPLKQVPPVRYGELFFPSLLPGEAGGTCKPTQPGAVSNNTLGRKSGQDSLTRGGLIQIKRFDCDQKPEVGLLI